MSQKRQVARVVLGSLFALTYLAMFSLLIETRDEVSKYEGHTLRLEAALQTMGSELNTLRGTARSLQSVDEEEAPRALGLMATVGASGTAVGCYSFTADTTIDMNALVYNNCFVASGASAIVLKIAKCSTKLLKTGTAMSGTTHIYSIDITNAGSSPLTVQACNDATCTSPVSYGIVPPESFVQTSCFAGGSNELYFPPAAGGACISSGLASTAVVTSCQGYQTGILESSTNNLAGTETITVNNAQLLANSKIICVATCRAGGITCSSSISAGTSVTFTVVGSSCSSVYTISYWIV